MNNAQEHQTGEKIYFGWIGYGHFLRLILSKIKQFVRELKGFNVLSLRKTEGFVLKGMLNPKPSLNKSTNFDYSLTDLSGKPLWSFSSKESKITLPIFKNDLPTATYILKITAENLNFSTKIVKE